MTGPEFKKWGLEAFRPEQLAALLGMSVTTLYAKFRSAVLDNKTVLAIAQLGCSQAKAEAAKALRFKAKATGTQ